MPHAPATSVPTHQEIARVRTFLDRVFWTLGIFCFVWSESAVIGVLRRRDSELPIIGKTQINETIVFTLLGLSFLLPILLLIVHAYRDAAAKYDWETRFPGTPSGEWEIPASFKRMRAGIFVALVVFPAATMVFLCASMATEMKFVDIRHSDVELTGTEIFLGPSKSIPESSHDWRWIEIGTQTTDEKIVARPSAYRWEPWVFSLIAGASGCLSLFYLLFPSGKKPHRELRNFA